MDGTARYIVLYPLRGTFTGRIWPESTTIKAIYEDSSEWRGYPIGNPNCPLLTYPKFAWYERIPDTFRSSRLSL